MLLACVFEKIVKVPVNEFRIKPLFFVSLPGYTWQCGLKNTGINIQTLQEKDINLTLENKTRGGISAVIGDRYVKSDENKKILYMCATNLCGHSMVQPSSFDEIEMWHSRPDLYMKKLDEISNIPDDSDIGYFLAVDLRYPKDTKKFQRISHLLLKKRLFLKMKLIFI